MTQPHRQCAAVLITNDKAQLLIVRQAYGKRFYAFPGGVVDPGESPPQAALREAKEEVDVEVALDYIIGTYLLKGGGWPDIFASVYAGHIVSGMPSNPNPDEIASVNWFNLQDVPAHLPPDVSAALEDFQGGKRGVVRDVWRTVDMGTPPR